MQLVGPRPEVSRYVEMLHSQFAELLQEAPGLTDPASLAYIDEGNKFSSIKLDNQYVSEIFQTNSGCHSNIDATVLSSPMFE
jgi:lipopolysaccharide/colanic/teichoic acid biosynthesis glycosyltransferase